MKKFIHTRMNGMQSRCKYIHVSSCMASRPCNGLLVQACEYVQIIPGYE